MKLRNKKTGKIVECKNIVFARCKVFALDWETYTPNVNSLAELNEEWEDYKPTEPLIKDEKIRKAVRAWAEANEFKSVFYDYDDFYGVARFILGETVMIIETNEILKEHRGYTIAELCGEGEE